MKPEQNINSTETKFTPNKTTIQNRIFTFLSVVAGYIIGKYLGLLVVIIFISAFFLGQKLPQWYFKKERINISLINYIAWSNILAWLLPPLGIMIGVATLDFKNHIPSNNKKYKVLAIFGILASLLNALSGVLTNMK